MEDLGLTKKEKKKIMNARYRAANKEALKQKRDSKKESLREYSAKYYTDNKSQFKTKYYQDKIKSFVVYTHTNGTDTYVGSGTNLRPSQKQGRSQGWKIAFNKGFKSEVLFECSTKEEAKIKEMEIINMIGTDNLINIHTK